MTEITIAIATFNRAAQLRRCLDALARQTASSDSYEVVVVDDGSTDGTADMLATYQAPYALRVERQENRGQPVALNRAISMAAGVHCIFLDDDILADPGLVEGHLRVQRDRHGVLGLGALRLRTAGARGGLTRYFAAWWEEHYRRFDHGEREPDFWACYSGNLSAPTRTLRGVGGFREDLGRSFDVELAYRLVRAGLEIVYLPHAAGEQRDDKGFRELARDFDRAGAAAVAMWRAHPELARYAPLGDFSQGGTRTILLRRMLLATRAPVWPLALLDPFLARRPHVRLYRILQLHCFWRSVRATLDDRATWRRLTRGTVILMYHAIGAPGERASRYVLSAGRLRRQLRWLRWTRRPVLSLDEYVRFHAEQRLPPAGSVVLTFDDGYADTVDRALPILSRSRLPAAVFVVSGAVGESNDWDQAGPLAGRRLVSWAGLRELRDAGMTVGAHTVSHPRLTDLDEQAAMREIAESRAALGEALGASVDHFAYPYGNGPAGIQDLVRACGFASACGIQPGGNGPAVPIYDLRRMEVWGTRSLPRFALDLWLGRHLRSPHPKRGG
jgi:glycosyltransferase involved in cell wall biosynthesis/peptidoglycan/xylan/chitin deacetylase (PgdA/CDA1 family)